MSRPGTLPTEVRDKLAATHKELSADLIDRDDGVKCAV